MTTSNQTAPTLVRYVLDTHHLQGAINEGKQLKSEGSQPDSITQCNRAMKEVCAADGIQLFASDARSTAHSKLLPHATKLLRIGLRFDCKWWQGRLDLMSWLDMHKKLKKRPLIKFRFSTQKSDQALQTLIFHVKKFRSTVRPISLNAF